MSTCERFVLSGRVSLSNPEIMDIGFYDIEDNTDKFNIVGKTNTWCWQMGSRLQWLPGKEKTVMYNSLVDNSYTTLIKTLDGKTVSKRPYPVYALDSKGIKCLSLNFSRLQRLRPGYGYDVLPDQTESVHEPKDDGIFFGNFEFDKLNLICSIYEVSQINRKKSMDNSMHYFNHLSFSPDSNIVLFFHLWVDKYKKKHCRAMFIDPKDRKIRELVKPEFTPSHFCWINNKNLIFTLATGPEGLGYYKVSIDGGIPISLEKLNDNVLDGHPSYLRENNTILTDTTPDKYSDRILYSYNLKTYRKRVIGKFYSPVKMFGENRCDLHPRVSKKYICIDSSHEGYRGMYLLKNNISEI